MYSAIEYNEASVASQCATNEKKESSFQCCIKDEGRPFTYALQEEYVNRFMVLFQQSGMVLSDEEKAS